MLAGLRNAAKSKFAIPIIALIAISFAVWGVSDAFRSGANDAVAVVGKEKVTVDDFARSFRSQVQNLSQSAGETVTTADARRIGLDRQLLSQLITTASLDAKAAALGLEASDTALADDIRNTAAFRDNVRGEFSRDVYMSMLASIGMNQSQYERSTRKDVTRGQMLDAILTPARVPETLAQARRDYANERRTVDVLVLPAALAPLDQEPDDAALQATLEENATRFTQPELRGATVVWLDMETMQAIADIHDEDVQALYEFRRESLSTPTTRAYAQIAAPDEATANEAARRLGEGEDPAEIAAALGLGEPNTATRATRADIVDTAIAARIFESTEPRSFAVEGGLGWAAVRVDGGEEAVSPSFEDVAAQLRAELAEENALDALYDAVSELEDARGAGMTLEQAATAAGLAAHTYAPISNMAADENGAMYFDLAQAPQVMSAIFSLNLSQTSELLELGDGGFAMVRVDSVTPPRAATLDEVREDVVALWRAQQLDNALRAVEQDARERIEAGASFREAAEAIGQPARSEIAVIRRGQTSGPVDAQLSASVFEAAEGELVSGRTSGDSRVLARVSSIEIAPPAGEDPAGNMGDELTNDLLQQLQVALQGEYPVRVYEDQINLALGDAPEQ